MSWSTRNANKKWTPEEVREIRRLANQNTPTRVIAFTIGRTPEAIQTKASEERISLKPPNQSPYNRRKS